MIINNPKLLWQLTFEGSWPTAVAFLDSSRKLAAANQDGQIFVWDLPEEPPAFEPDKKNSERKAPNHWPARRLDGHTNGVTRLIATDDGRTLVSSSLDHSIRIWEPLCAATGAAEAILDGDERKNRARREKKEDILTEPGVMVETLPSVATLAGHDDWILTIGASAGGRKLISGDAAARVIVWDLHQRREIVRFAGRPWNWIVAAAHSANGETALVSEYRYKRDDFDIPAAALRLVDAATGKEKLDILKTMFPKLKPEETSYGSAQVWRKFVAHGLIAADFSPDGSLVALAQGGETDTGKIQLIDTATGKLVREVSGHQYGATDVKFSQDGKLVLSTGRDTTLRICQIEDGKEVAALGSPRGGQFKDWLSALAISPDETTVAAADIAGLVHIWRLAG
jgi:WD40 repeat protein